MQSGTNRFASNTSHQFHASHVSNPTLVTDHKFVHPVKRRWLGKAARRLSVLLLAAVTGVALFATLSKDGTSLATPKSLRADLEKLAILAGFGIDQVTLTGHRFTLEDKIFDALDLPNMHSLLSFEPKLLRERLQRLPWIKTVEASRIYPGQLKIRVTERDPAAVWNRGGQHYLIDDGGRVLASVDAGVLDHLPMVKGEGATNGIDQLFALLGRFPEVAGFVTSSERVGQRRWTLHLVGGGALHLPQGQEAQALDKFLSRDKAREIVQSGTSIIDLRAEGRISIRPAPPATRISSRRQGMG